MRFHTENPTIYDGIMGWDDALIAAAITAAASAGTAYYNNEQAGNRFDQQMAAMGTNQLANMQFNQSEAFNARLYNQLETVNARLFAQGERDVAFQRNQENFATAQQLANSTYQRTMSDMRQAGLNPILAYQRGAANNTPQPPTVTPASSGQASGSGASSSVPGLPGLPRTENILGGGAVSAALQAAQTIGAVDLQRANIKKVEQDTALSAAQTIQSNTASALQTAQAITEGVRPDNIRSATNLNFTNSTLNSARTATEGTVQNLNRETTDLRRAQTDREATAAHDDRRFGRGPLGQAAASGVRTGDTLGRSLPTPDSIYHGFPEILRNLR